MKHETNATRWVPAPVRTVCAHIARAALGERDVAHAARHADFTDTADISETLSMGQITLRPHQYDAVQRIRASITTFGGALLSDAVGLGKTYVALALSRHYAHAHIIAPATLLPMWRSAISAGEIVNVTLHSLHILSRRPVYAAPSDGPILVIVDEAHHLRTRNTVRYRHAEQFAAGRDVLLMTATPVHNRTHELRNLLGLFLGNRADALDRATLGTCVIRRTVDDAPTESVPAIHEHAALAIPDNRAVLECLLQLAPPLPVSEGTAASALVRLGLLRAWCSSDAALTDRIRRRQLRGEALLHSLAHGRYPTQRELEAWIVGNDSVQLGFPELLIASASGDTSLMLKTLSAHLDSLQQLLQIHLRTSIADASRSSALRALLQSEQPSPILAFSQFASTVRALHRALSDMAGVASLTSHGGRIASGAIARQELIANFAPTANGRPPPGASQQIRLLITTDLLAEGVNLQDAGVVVHLDLPWTHALKQQRVGRLARMGSKHAIVHVHTFAPPMGAEAALRLVATLERKAGLHRAWVGKDGDYAPAMTTNTISAPEEATALRHTLQKWRTDPPAVVAQATQVAILRSTEAGWIAVANIGGEVLTVARLVARVSQSESDSAVGPHTRETIGTSPATLLRAVLLVRTDSAGNVDERAILPVSDGENDSVARALHELDDWLQTHELQSLAGRNARSLSPTQKRALDALSQRLRETSAARRPALAILASAAEERILNIRGSGAERELAQWTTQLGSLTTRAWFDAFPAGNESHDRTFTRDVTGDVQPRVLALLLLQPEQRAPDDESLK